MKGFGEIPGDSERQEADIATSAQLADFFKDWQVIGKLPAQARTCNPARFPEFAHESKTFLTVHEEVLQEVGLSLEMINLRDFTEAVPGAFQVMPMVKDGKALADTLIEKIAGTPYAEECRQNVQAIIDYHLAKAPQSAFKIAPQAFVERYGHDTDLRTQPTEAKYSDLDNKRFYSLQEVAANAGDLQIALHELESGAKDLEKLTALQMATNEDALLDYVWANYLGLTPGCWSDYIKAYSPWFHHNDLLGSRETTLLHSLLDVRDKTAPESRFTHYLYGQSYARLTKSLDLASQEATKIYTMPLLKLKELEGFSGKDIKATFNKRYLALITTHERCQTWLQARGLLEENT